MPTILIGGIYHIMAKLIPLTKGKFAIVDDDDFEYLNQWKWYCSTQNRAVREQSIGNNRSKMIWMHRVINKTPDGLDTDHKDRDPLNNQKSNLRTLSHHKNMFNRTLAKNNNSGHSGISWFKDSNKWRAYITVMNKQIHLGLYSSLDEAILKRKEAELKYHAI